MFSISAQFHRIADRINPADTCKNQRENNGCRALDTAHQFRLAGHLDPTRFLRIFDLMEIVLHIRDIAECDRHRIADVVADSECGLKTLQTPTDWS